MNRNASEVPKVDTFAVRANQVVGKRKSDHFGKSPGLLDLKSQKS